MVFKEETDKRSEEPPSPKGVGMVNHKVAIMGDLRCPKLHLLGVSDQIVMAEEVEPPGDCFGTTARRICCSDDAYSHTKRITLKIKI
jgi:hypothetical protein